MVLSNAILDECQELLESVESELFCFEVERISPKLESAQNDLDKLGLPVDGLEYAYRCQQLLAQHTYTVEHSVLPALREKTPKVVSPNRKPTIDSESQLSDSIDLGYARAFLGAIACGAIASDGEKIIGINPRQFLDIADSNSSILANWIEASGMSE